MTKITDYDKIGTKEYRINCKIHIYIILMNSIGRPVRIAHSNNGQAMMIAFKLNPFPINFQILYYH